MKYIGKLYGKFGGEYIPLIPTSEDFDKMESDLAACRAFIQDAIDYNHIQDADKQAAQEILNLTKP
jgi:hypothetical protein